ncbi:hypothetical protein Tco_0810829 [Tanacetum coccineum]
MVFDQTPSQSQSQQQSGSMMTSSNDSGRSGGLAENTNTNPSASPDPFVLFITEKVRDNGDVMFIKIVKKNDDSRKEESEAGGLEVEYFDIFPTQSELAYHKYLICGPIPSIFLRNPIIRTRMFHSNLKYILNMV